MNLDDLDRFKQLDTLNMLGEIDDLPDQLGFAYQLGLKHELPEWKGIRQVVIAGMGGSAIGADLLASYSATLAPLQVSVLRDYGLPLFARCLFLSIAIMDCPSLRAAQRRSSFVRLTPAAPKRLWMPSKLRAKLSAVSLS